MKSGIRGTKFKRRSTRHVSEATAIASEFGNSALASCLPAATRLNKAMNEMTVFVVSVPDLPATGICWMWFEVDMLN